MGFSGLQAVFHRAASAGDSSEGYHYGPTYRDQWVESPFGPLYRNLDDVLYLPKGFTSHVISRQGETMDDGFLVPGSHDGSAAFAGPGGKILLVRNHEVEPQELEQGAFGTNYEMLRHVPKSKLYDYGHGSTPGLGATTTLLYDPKKQKLERHFLSLAGTVRNCAGGPTPWGSWISCEETVLRAGENGMEKDHGYNFEVPASAKPGLVDPVPLKAMGRFQHEAVAVGPVGGIVYQTEDRDDGLIYRYIPDTPGKLADGGRLEALVVLDQKSADTRNWDKAQFKVGQEVAVGWMPLEDIDSPDDGLDSGLRKRGFAAGAARFARGEGMWASGEAVYFACTNGGSARKGQIWKYTPGPAEGTAEEQKNPGKLQLFIEPDDGTIVENADNLTVAPFGHLFVCEDGPEHNNLLGVTPSGEVYWFAQNTTGWGELTGVTFSPDGSTCFVNIQDKGLTVAITGPWEKAHQWQ